MARVGDLDLSEVKAPGPTLEVPVARLVGPGETERLGVSIGARLPAGTFRRWDVRYELVADGEINYSVNPKPSPGAADSLFSGMSATPSRNVLKVTLPWDIDAHLRAPVN